MRNFNNKETYVDNDDPRLGILAVKELEIHSTKNGLKGYSPAQLLSGRNMILPIKHKGDW